MKKNYETELPDEYTCVLHINAADKKFGWIFNLIALGVFILVLAVVLPTANYKAFSFSPDDLDSLFLLTITLFSFCIAMLVYLVLHELAHGVAYKALTKQKLKFGLTWSCAYCGVPDIFVYRKTALIALLVPFVLFTLLLAPLTVWAGIVGSIAYIPLGALFGLHLGGCSGDLYMTGLLLFRYKDSDTLIRDKGAETFFFIKNENDKIKEK